LIENVWDIMDPIDKVFCFGNQLIEKATQLDFFFYIIKAAFINKIFPHSTQNKNNIEYWLLLCTNRLDATS